MATGDFKPRQSDFIPTARHHIREDLLIVNPYQSERRSAHQFHRECNFVTKTSTFRGGLAFKKSVRLRVDYLLDGLDLGIFVVVVMVSQRVEFVDVFTKEEQKVS